MLIVVLPLQAAELERFRFFTVAEVTHDRNVFRLADSTNTQLALGHDQRSDTATTLGVGVDMRLPISRQEVLAHVSIERSKYSTYSQLDYTARDLSANWKWVAGNNLSGDLSVGDSESLSDFADLNSTQRNLRQVRQYAAAPWFRWQPNWIVRGRVQRLEIGNSLASAADGNLRANMIEGGMQYQSDASNSVGVLVRRGHGRYPNRQVVGGLSINNAYTQDELEGFVDWRMPERWRTQARVAQVRRRHDEFSNRNFSGMTGRLTQDWFVAGKSTVTFVARREIGAYEDITSNYVVTTAARLSANWLATDKLSLNASVERRQRAFQGDPGLLAGVTQREDRHWNAALSASFEVMRNLLLSLQVSHETRISNLIQRDYKTTVIDANARLSF